MIIHRPFTMQDLPTLAHWVSSARDVLQWAGPLLHYPLNPQQWQRIAEAGEGDMPARLAWMAERDETPFGHAQLVLDRVQGNAALVYVLIAPSARGQGLTGPMLAPLIDMAFGIPDIMRLELNVYAHNRPAIRAYEKLGFVHEGCRRSSAKCGEERWDTCFMSILRHEHAGACRRENAVLPPLGDPVA